MGRHIDPEQSAAGLGAFCPYYSRAMELIGSRWTGAIVRAMLTGLTRFSDVKQAIPGLSDRMLSERLKALEAEGVIERCVTPSTPVRIDYRLTEKGQALADIVMTVSAWASEWLDVEADEDAAAASAG